MTRPLAYAAVAVVLTALCNLQWWVSVAAAVAVAGWQVSRDAWPR